jgi:hypothetical protein
MLDHDIKPEIKVLQQILDGVLSGPLFCAQSGRSLFLRCSRNVNDGPS